MNDEASDKFRKSIRDTLYRVSRNHKVYTLAMYIYIYSVCMLCVCMYVHMCLCVCVCVCERERGPPN